MSLRLRLHAAFLDADAMANRVPDVNLTTDFMPGNATSGARILGDYEAMLVRNFLRMPTCGGTGSFFPAYITADAGAVEATDLNRWVTTVEVTP